MGKLPNSKIHELYSNWHWNLIDIDSKYKKLYTADIDRLWIEYDFDDEEIVGILDIKWEDSGDTLTPTEKGIHKWFEKREVKNFVVYINKEFTKFRVIDKTKQRTWNEIQFADFLLALRNEKTFRKFWHNNKEYEENKIKISTDFDNYSKIGKGNSKTTTKKQKGIFD